MDEITQSTPAKRTNNSRQDQSTFSGDSTVESAATTKPTGVGSSESISSSASTDSQSPKSTTDIRNSTSVPQRISITKAEEFSGIRGSNTSGSNEESIQSSISKQKKRRTFYRKKITGTQDIPPSGGIPIWRRLKPIHGAVVIIAIGLVAIFTTTAQRVQAPGLVPTPTASVSATLAPTQEAFPTSLESIKKGGFSLYPNSDLTPGAILPVTSQQVCQLGYSSQVRNVSTLTKKQVYAEYHLTYPQPIGAYEVDHFIPLELGGSNDISNLWPEPAYPIPGFHQKDLVENYLHAQVCANKISLAQAQKEITTDWYSVYLQMAH